MTTLEELASMETRQLSLLLSTSVPELDDLGIDEWLAVVQLFTARLTEESESLSADEWVLGSDAIVRALGHAEAVGAIDRNERVIRRLNLSAALLQRVPVNSDVEILDPQRAYDEFVEVVPISPEEARDLASTNTR